MLECLTQFEVCSLLLAGLIGHLRTVSAPMYRLYVAMKERSPGEVTADEIAVASGKKILDPGALSVFLQTLESTSMTIQRAFEKQVNAAAVSPFIFPIYYDTEFSKGPWDQKRFEELLAKWIVAMDQPFYTVEDPEFRELMMYTHHPLPNLKIPHCNTVKSQIMKMGKDSIEATKRMFQVRKHLLLFHYQAYNPSQTSIEGKISISLDAWTSSNNYVFMAIVAHYITKAGQLGMLTNLLTHGFKG